jgi:hypothetical protein
MTRLGIAPHVADKVLNHQSGTISGVAAVYQRHEFLHERRNALERWGAHVGKVLMKALKESQTATRTAWISHDARHAWRGISGQSDGD